MPQEIQERRIDQFFSGPGARADNWRGSGQFGEDLDKEHHGDRSRFDAILAQLVSNRGISRLSGAVSDGGGEGACIVGRRRRRVALVCSSPSPCKRLVPSACRRLGSSRGCGRGNTGSVAARFRSTTSRRPYFETMIVTGLGATNWPNLAPSGGGCVVRTIVRL